MIHGSGVGEPTSERPWRMRGVTTVTDSGVPSVPQSSLWQAAQAAGARCGSPAERRQVSVKLAHQKELQNLFKIEHF